MNIKIEKFIKKQGYCCLWAWMEVHRRMYTSVLMEKLENICSVRALRYQRAAYRRKETICTKCPECLKQKIKDGHITQSSHTTDSRIRKDPGSAFE